MVFYVTAPFILSCRSVIITETFYQNLYFPPLERII